MRPSIARRCRSASAESGSGKRPSARAIALGTPTIALFGPETPTMYRPLGSRVRVLYRPPICSPCINVHENKLADCVHGQALCMTAIGVDEVLEHTRSELGQRCASSS